MANIKDQLNDQAITAKSLLGLMKLGFIEGDFTLFKHAVQLTKYNRPDTCYGVPIDEMFYECEQDYKNALAALEFLEYKTPTSKLNHDFISDLQSDIESKYGKKKENPYANLY